MVKKHINSWIVSYNLSDIRGKMVSQLLIIFHLFYLAQADMATTISPKFAPLITSVSF